MSGTTAEFDGPITAELWQGYRRLAEGNQPNSTQRTALRKLRKHEQARFKEELLANFSRADLAQMAGLQATGMRDLSMTHGAPLDKPKIPLGDFVKWAIDFVRTNSRAIQKIRKMREQEGDDPLEHAVINSQDRYLAQRARLTELQVMQVESQLVDVATLKEGLEGQLIRRLRTLTRGMQDKFGDAAARFLNDNLDSIERDIGRFFERLLNDRTAKVVESNGHGKSKSAATPKRTGGNRKRA